MAIATSGRRKAHRSGHPAKVRKATMSSRSAKPGKPAKPAAGAEAAGARAEKPERGDRSKRLLDLVMMLMRSRLPVAYREIRDQFPAYQTANAEAGLRAFERDKAELLELGVPVRYISAEEDDSLEDGGYVIDLRRMRQPEVHLTPDEVSALVLAASMARSMPGGAYPQIVDLALKKLAFDVPESPSTPTAFLQEATSTQVLVHVPQSKAPAVEGLDEAFATIEAATRLRKRVGFTYHNAGSGVTSRRELEPYALVHRDGAWLAIGMCLLRKDVRSFRIDRMRDVSMGPKPKSPDFERPPTFDARAYSNRSPWTFGVEPVEPVVLAFAAAAADAAAEDFGADATRRTERGTEGDVTIVAFACGNPEFVVQRILAAKGAITVRQGERLRARLAAEVAAIAALYGDAALGVAAGVGDSHA